MATLRKHRPAFAESYAYAADEIGEFTTRRDLFTIPFVAAWVDHPDFSHFSACDASLVVHLEDGSRWIVGYSDPPEALRVIAAGGGPHCSPPGPTWWQWLTYYMVCQVIGHRWSKTHVNCTRCGSVQLD